MLIDAITEQLHELLKYRFVAPATFLCEARAVMVMAIDGAFVLIIAILSAEDGRTDRTSEVLDVVLTFERGDVRASKGASAIIAEKVEPTEIVRLAQRILVRRLVGDGEELGGHDLATILRNHVSNAEMKMNVWALDGHDVRGK